MMTRKDYVATAEILNSYVHNLDAPIFDCLVQDFVAMFAEDNDRFLVDKFEDACWGTARDQPTPTRGSGGSAVQPNYVAD